MTDQVERVARVLDPWAWNEFNADEEVAPRRRKESLLNARAAIAAMDQWLPIESAPTQHMTRADLYVPFPETPDSSILSAGRITDCTFSTAFDPPTWGKTYYDGSGPHFVKIEGAAHWMPAPDPPETQS